MRGVGVAVLLSLVAALIIFIQASPIRLRFFPAALVALFFFVLEAVPIWFFLTPHTFVSIQVEYLVLLPHLCVRALLCFRAGDEIYFRLHHP